MEGLGNVGEKVCVRQNYAYDKLLIPGLAVYASPENIERYSDQNVNKEKEYSSANALYVSWCLVMSYFQSFIHYLLRIEKSRKGLGKTIYLDPFLFLAPNLY